MEKTSAKQIIQPIEPRDPVAYPHYPQRLRGAARPRFEVTSEPVEDAQPQQPTQPRRD